MEQSTRNLGNVIKINESAVEDHLDRWFAAWLNKL